MSLACCVHFLLHVDATAAMTRRTRATAAQSDEDMGSLK